MIARHAVTLALLLAPVTVAGGQTLQPRPFPTEGISSFLFDSPLTGGDVRRLGLGPAQLQA